MRHLGSELERRECLRHRQGIACEMFLAGRSHAMTVVDLSRGGAFVHGDAVLWPGALVRLRIRDAERYAIVLRERHVPHHLRRLVPRGYALRWIGRGAAR